MKVILNKERNTKGDCIIIFCSKKVLKANLSNKEYKFSNKKLKDKSIVDLSVFVPRKYVVLLDSKNQEENRRLGAEIADKLSDKTYLHDFSSVSNSIISFLEGIMLKSYDFCKYKSNIDFKLKFINLISSNLSKEIVFELNGLIGSVFKARDWINEPVNKLTTNQYLKEIKSLENLGVVVEVLRKSKIKTLGMGGIMGVNQGSHDEPAFVKSEWKPENSKNKKPIVLIGKGVLFDTGGINIKTGDFMSNMKADMGGSSMVLGALRAIAIKALPVNVIVLTPITENRINGKELVPGDIIKMYDGKNVEVLNTDAEGRLILADALTFAKKLDPMLVIDSATLTGSAFKITGNHGAVIMGTDDKNIKALKKAGEEVYERLLELPMWEEFNETLQSNVADINNLGSIEGQAVCAGFFLKSFTDYPWVHIDIAGPAFRNTESYYLPKGGTGFGVRLLYQFFKNNFVN
tara:strand:+ start:901 stop:2286 length:1386 start_codon:yes stop_codon:yes gene_type:complete